MQLTYLIGNDADFFVCVSILRVPLGVNRWTTSGLNNIGILVQVWSRRPIDQRAVVQRGVLKALSYPSREQLKTQITHENEMTQISGRAYHT